MFKVNSFNNNLFSYLIILKLNILKVNIKLRLIYKGNYALIILINNN